MLMYVFSKSRKSGGPDAAGPSAHLWGRNCSKEEEEIPPKERPDQDLLPGVTVTASDRDTYI